MGQVVAHRDLRGILHVTTQVMGSRFALVTTILTLVSLVEVLWVPLLEERFSRRQLRRPRGISWMQPNQNPLDLL